MDRFKINASIDSASEIIDMLVFMGCELISTKEHLLGEVNSGNTKICESGRGIFTTMTEYNSLKEITFQQLKDMVVLKRNDAGDANFEDENGDLFYKTLDGKDLYRWFCGSRWASAVSYAGILKPIQKDQPMKECLVKTDNGNYLYTKNVSDIAAERVIEIPQGANVYARCNIFGDYKWLPKIIDGDWSVLWQREKESLNDKMATAEVARQQSKNIDATLAERQSQYGGFEDVAFVTENIMSTLAKVRPNGLQDLPHTHRMALYMIASKMARIVNGDFNHLDSWHDIGGYSKLIEDLIGDNNEI